MKKRAFDTLKFIIGWPLSLLALYFIFRLISPQISEISQSIKTINIPLLFLSVLCFLGYYFLRTVLWHELIKNRGIRIPLRETVYLWSISEINRYIPGNIWSLLSRSVRFGQKNMSKKEIATTLVHETVFVLIGAVLVCLFSLPFLSTLDILKPVFTIVQPKILISLVLALTVLFIFQKRILRILGKPAVKFAFLLPYTPYENIRFILLSFSSLFFFGFGYYFAIASVVQVPLAALFTLASFAVVSLLVGYLSFFTPTGLGVREGILTFGLVKFTTVALAGFASLFARIMLIFSEVLFLSLASIWFKLRHTYLEKIENTLTRDKTKTLLVLSVGIYTFYVSVASFLRFENFYTGRYDLGNMVQTVWNTSEGRFFLFTNPDSTEIVSRLAFHADFILVFFAPLYLLFGHPNLLLFSQALIVGCGAFFLYGIANHLLQNKTASLLIAVSYLINPSVLRSNLYDFHAVVLATTFFLAAWYFYLKKRYILLIVFLLLAALTKEQVWVITGLFGFYLIAHDVYSHIKNNISLRMVLLSPQFLMGISIFVVSVLLFYLFVWHLIPQARGGEHFALEFYGEFGTGPSDVLLSILYEPLKVFQTIFSGARLEYLKQLFQPVGYLPLAFPLILVFALPDLLINTLSSNSNFHQIYYQYTATITPFLFIGAVYGIWVITKYTKKIPVLLLACYLFIMALYGTYKFGPLPGAKRPNLAMFDQPTKNRYEIAEYLANIPKEAKVAATNNAGSHLSEREYIFTIPLGIDEADYLVFLVDPHPRRDLDQKERIQTIAESQDFELVMRLENFYVFKRVRYLVITE